MDSLTRVLHFEDNEGGTKLKVTDDKRKTDEKNNGRDATHRNVGKPDIRLKESRDVPAVTSMPHFGSSLFLSQTLFDFPETKVSCCAAAQVLKCIDFS